MNLYTSFILYLSQVRSPISIFPLHFLILPNLIVFLFTPHKNNCTSIFSHKVLILYACCVFEATGFCETRTDFFRLIETTPLGYLFVRKIHYSQKRCVYMRFSVQTLNLLSMSIDQKSKYPEVLSLRPRQDNTPEEDVCGDI